MSFLFNNSFFQNASHALCITSLITIFYFIRPAFLGSYLAALALPLLLFCSLCLKPKLSLISFFYQLFVLLVLAWQVFVYFVLRYDDIFLSNSLKLFASSSCVLFSIFCIFPYCKTGFLYFAILLGSVPVFFGFLLYNILGLEPFVLFLLPRKEALQDATVFFQQMAFVFPGSFGGSLNSETFKFRFSGLFPEPGLYQLLPLWFSGVCFFIYRRFYAGILFCLLGLLSLSTNSFVSGFFLFLVLSFSSFCSFHHRVLSIIISIVLILAAFNTDKIGVLRKMEDKSTGSSFSARADVISDFIISASEHPFGTRLDRRADQGINLLGSATYLGLPVIFLSLLPLIPAIKYRVFKQVFCSCLSVVLTALFFQPIFFTPIYFSLFLLSFLLALRQNANFPHNHF